MIELIGQIIGWSFVLFICFLGIGSSWLVFEKDNARKATKDAKKDINVN